MPDKHKDNKDKINHDKIEEEYGLSYALFQAFPELKTLLKHAVGQSWTASKFQVELRQTDWFKKHSDIWRENTALKFSDPASYKERLGNSLTSVKNLSQAYGANLSNEAAQRLAERSLLFGFSEDQIRDVLANHVLPSAAGHYGGQLSAVEGTLRATALANGVHVGDHQLKNWMRNIVRGNSSQDQYETFIRDVAGKTFSAYGEQIKGGMNIADLAAPYVQSMSQILEVNPASVDMFDPTIRRAMSYKNAKGDQVPMSISDFEDTLRNDKRWQYTKQAKDQALGYANSIAKMWGLQS